MKTRRWWRETALYTWWLKRWRTWRDKYAVISRIEGEPLSPFAIHMQAETNRLRALRQEHGLRVGPPVISREDREYAEWGV